MGIIPLQWYSYRAKMAYIRMMSDVRKLEKGEEAMVLILLVILL